MGSTELVGDISEVQGTRYKRVSEAMIKMSKLSIVVNFKNNVSSCLIV